jgi:beta-lactamase superfamily II metal-dependent hydrolase
MARIFEVHVLPAGNGDCIWIEYGDASSPHRILIDGGTQGTYKRLKKKIQSLNLAKVHFDLLVITHIDGDHIAGVLELLERNELPVSFGDIWFNGYRHLPAEKIEDFGALQGERLTKALLDPKKKLRWNANPAFQGGRICVQEDGSPTQAKDFFVGLEIFVMSPGIEQLAALRPVWEKECSNAGLDPKRPVEEETALPLGIEAMGAIDVDSLAATKFKEDEKPANGVSIALLIRYEGKSVLLAGDAFPSVITRSVEGLGGHKPLTVDLLKLPHHGSQNNVNQELIEKVPASHFVFSSNGATYGHPDPEGVARVVKYGGCDAQLVFNYRSKITQVWDEAGLKKHYGFSVGYGDGESPSVIKLL